MAFWAITAVLTGAVLALLIRTALRARGDGESPAAYDLRVYRDQLEEVERDVARGVLNTDDAERVRVEISRRILAADAAAKGDARSTMQRGQTGMLGAMTALVAGIAYVTYLQLGAPGYGDLALADRIAISEALRADRPDQATAEAAQTANTTPTQENADYLRLVEQLRTTLSGRPDDLRGHRLLAQAETRLGNFAAAHVAQARVIALTGATDAPVEDWANYADLLVLAAGGYVSPQAEEVLQSVLTRDPGNGTARYYWGLMQSQVGRPDIAFRMWDSLLREGPEDAPWIEPVVVQIEEMAARAGVRYQIPVIGSGRGPSAADIEAAGDLSPTERLQMIEGMVSGLSDRLANEGGPPEDWAQLITALGVLGRIQDAGRVFANAQAVFGDNPGAMDIINSAADRAGLL